MTIPHLTPLVQIMTSTEELNIATILHKSINPCLFKPAIYAF